MTKGRSVLEVAIKQIGYKEDPPNSNKTKYGKWFGFDGVAWCGMAVSWCYAQSGHPLGNIGYAKGFAGCQTAYNHFLKTGEITTTPQDGDIVLYDWNSDGRFDHTGIFETWTHDGKFTAIEGNTSIGNDSNGGEYMRRERDTRKYRVVFVHPKVLD